MNQRAIDFATALRGWVASLGAGVKSASVTTHSTWTMVKITAMSDEVLMSLAGDLGLTQAATASRGRTWWREMSSTENGVLVVACGPHHDALSSDDEVTAKRSLPS